MVAKCTEIGRIMFDYILLSSLNDFIFCPYSIYLHNVYMGGDEALVHAVPQIKGKAAHTTIDEKRYSSRKDVITSMSVYCLELGIAGKIDIYRKEEQLLIERKYRMDTVYKGQILQLWGQYFCLSEMGYEVNRLAFYVISSNKNIPIELPGEAGKKEMQVFIEKFKNYDLEKPFLPNINKCKHCIYCNLCDKTNTNHVYT